MRETVKLVKVSSSKMLNQSVCACVCIGELSISVSASDKQWCIAPDEHLTAYSCHQCVKVTSVFEWSVDQKLES